jgi:hypothetical protein
VVLDRHVPDLSPPVHAHGAQVDRSRALQVLREGERLGLGLRHRVHQVETRSAVGEHLGDEDALVDLEALLVLLGQLALGVDRRSRGQEVGEPLGSLVDELRDP